MDALKLRQLIQEVLTGIGEYSPDAEELLMATCANESNLGRYRTQAKGGPGKGIFQIEVSDFNDIWVNYLQYHKDLADKVKALNNDVQGTANDLVNNDRYSIAMCRVHYLRSPGALPNCKDLDAIWAYYKQYYNTPEGAAVESIFKYKYNAYVLGETDGDHK
jgi:hypothetical protein